MKRIDSTAKPRENTPMDRKEPEKIKKRLAELEVLIAETQKRLPAHSTKPPVMLYLLEYEDEYDLLLEKLNALKAGR
jgi:hypothetical protein